MRGPGLGLKRICSDLRSPPLPRPLSTFLSLKASLNKGLLGQLFVFFFFSFFLSGLLFLLIRSLLIFSYMVPSPCRESLCKILALRIIRTVALAADHTKGLPGQIWKRQVPGPYTSLIKADFWGWPQALEVSKTPRASVAQPGLGTNP